MHVWNELDFVSDTQVPPRFMNLFTCYKLAQCINQWLFPALGPLLCEKDGKWYLHGISSFGHDACAIAYKYGVYTRVSQFKKWVKKVTGIDC
jgi:hypothetical protein